jgi:intraflagellar transport protein 56
VYLESISTYLSPSSAAFNWNYGLCLAVVASSDATDSATSIKYYLQAQECLERARTLSRQLANDITLICWLARCYIRGNVSNNAINGSHVHAWELFLEMERSAPLMDARAVLKIVANDYYITRRFFLAARAFDALERLENSVDPELWEAKRGACVGFFRQVATGEERDSPGNGMKTRAVVPPLLSTRVDEMLSLLARSTNALEASKLTAMLKKWVVSLKLR